MGLNEKFFKSASGGGVPVGTDNFMPVIYSGNDSTRNITVGFQPDLIITKCRTTDYSHMVTDSVRGGSENLRTNTKGAKETLTTLNFQSNGYQIVWGGGSNSDSWNNADDTFVAWCWKAGGSAVSNTDGTTASTVSANTAAGFSIVKWVGTRPTANTIGHGLGVTPQMIIIKNMSISDSDWTVYAESEGATKHGILDTSAAWGANNGAFNNVTPASSVFTVGGDAFTNGAGNNIIAYCFANKSGYQKVGAFNGTNGAGNRIYTTDDDSSSGSGGFQPRFILIKPTYADSWRIFDSARGNTKELRPNTEFAETTQTVLSFNSDGFTMTGGDANQNPAPIVYLAIA